MVGQLVEQQTARLLKHVVRCFLRYLHVPQRFPVTMQCADEYPTGSATTTEPARPSANVSLNR
jgi:CCR4-NOT transcription complex subunit 9